MEKSRSSLLVLLVPLFLSSCHPRPGMAYLFPDDAALPGYSVRGAEGIFNGKDFTAAARQIRKGDVSDPLLESLLEKDFVIISMTLENKSSSKVIYKPNYTALMNSVDYLKPLDYTDLYEFGGEAADSLKGRFFDLDVTLAPGGKSTGLLIFRPLSEDARSAVIEVRELYIGTETSAFSLPFKLKSNPS